MVKNEIVGKKFNMLKILSFQGKINKKRYFMKCLCDCGNIKIIERNKIISGKTKSCGCLNSKLSSERKLKNEIGKKYNKLTVIKREGSATDNSALWLCRCDCGELTVVSGKKLRSGHTKSCGCNQVEAMRSAKNPFWRGGKPKGFYPANWTESLKKKIRFRDQSECQICGEKENDKKHCIHHIDYNKNNLNKYNLITVCKKCHVQTNKNRSEWENFLKYKVGYWQCFE